MANDFTNSLLILSSQSLIFCVVCTAAASSTFALSRLTLIMQVYVMDQMENKCPGKDGYGFPHHNKKTKDL